MEISYSRCHQSMNHRSLYENMFHFFNIGSLTRKELLLYDTAAVILLLRLLYCMKYQTENLISA
jgi:hypothetical protein